MRVSSTDQNLKRQLVESLDNLGRNSDEIIQRLDRKEFGLSGARHANPEPRDRCAEPAEADSQHDYLDSLLDCP